VQPLTVSQLTGMIDGALRTTLPPTVLVKGEVSNFKRNGSSGHVYFTLKDARACIDCVMFKTEAAALRFAINDGLELLAEGRVAVYPQRGRYQLYVDVLQPLGKGALELAFQQLRAKLEAEGLFAEGRKRPLPDYPARIVIITGTQTAALQDVLKVLCRFPWLRLFVYPVTVQGKGAAQEIAAALAHVNGRADSIGGVDLILLARGGGSLEDLWAFNEEVVARAIAASRLPVVTGIGHEIDTSIADLVADYHAHTPTEAAQVIARNWRTAGEALDGAAVRLGRELRNALSDAHHRLAAVERHEAFRRPLDRVNHLRQLLDDRQRNLGLHVWARYRTAQWRVGELENRLAQVGPAFLLARFRARLGEVERQLVHGATQRLLRAKDHVARLDTRHVRLDPRHRIDQLRERLDGFEARLCCGMGILQQRRRQMVESLERFLRAVGPEEVLRRGYSITFRKKGGAVIRSAAEVRPGDKLLTRFADGEVESTASDRNQPGLFD
jgi:exodeoxyribonuclease VII large subunit